jgi:hypothetical protein
LKLNKLIYVVIIINSFPLRVSSLPFDLSLTINGAKNGTNYLRAEIFKDGTTNYYGETYNGKDWYSGNDGKNYFPVQINSSSVSATIKVKSGEIEPGAYKLKIKRYTASGNAASDEEKEVDVNFKNEVQATSIPTSTPDATVIMETKAEINPTPTESPTIIPTVLAESTIIPIQPKKIVKKETFNILPPLIFATGLFVLSIPILMFVKKRIDKV